MIASAHGHYQIFYQPYQNIFSLLFLQKYISFEIINNNRSINQWFLIKQYKTKQKLPDTLGFMKIFSYYQKAKNHIIRFIHLQLFITAISIPIVLCWGLPLSFLSFAGNLLLAPILTAFLLLCSMIFFFQLLGLPNAFLITCLQTITHWWLVLMHQGSTGFLVGLPLPSMAVLIVFFLITLAILHYKKITTAYKGILCYMLLLAGIGAYLKYHVTPHASIDTLACNNGTITIIKTHQQLIIIDPGVIGRRLSAPSWCEYTLMPHLIKKFGCNTIDHLLILAPNRIIFDTLTTLQEKITIKNIYIPLWKGKLPFYWWRSYIRLREHCAAKECKLVPIAQKPLHIRITPSQKITITALEQTIAKDDFEYPCFKVACAFDNQTWDIYSAKYKIPAIEKKEEDGTPRSIDDHCP